MAGEQFRKRRATDNTSQNNPSPKKRKSTSTRKIAPNFPSFFYDELSEVPLTVDTLRELDRRTEERVRNIKTAVSTTRSLLRFSRRGGPDLRHLRGFPSPKPSSAIMEKTPSSISCRSRVTQSTRATGVSSRSGRSSAYDKGFQQHLIDYGIYPNGYKAGDGRPTFEPSDLDNIQEALLYAKRASLSLSNFTQLAFQDFKSKNNRVTFKSDVISTIIPVICGDSRIHSQQNVLFTELEPITSTDAVKPKPDFFDGAFLVDVNEDIRNDIVLRRKVIPTKHHSVPVASNFFMEVKGPDGNASVAQRQACYDGAYGARAMHALQNYGKAEPEYDGYVKTYSSTYHPATGSLQLYAHHITAPVSGSGGRPEYHMTKLCGFDMTNNRATFVQGATVLRNARELAKEHRDQVIQAANEKAAKAKEQSDKRDQESASWQDAHDALQEELAETCEH
ncbi:hypothetical protein NOR_07672 [Metarhizium rileyi]|uniref:Uncharacterized protein n=1 Tax=Metarhizium rileyi (strain RCEF 4871) TaxID=1649241 RepID=A0A166XQD4_METRR|nr:hypothetical protein NOR_07672 [Metarhizium rileyi RCEF 4871]